MIWRVVLALVLALATAAPAEAFKSREEGLKHQLEETRREVLACEADNFLQRRRVAALEEQVAEMRRKFFEATGRWQ
jgi:TolA-binding protein